MDLGREKEGEEEEMREEEERLRELAALDDLIYAELRASVGEEDGEFFPSSEHMLGVGVGVGVEDLS